MSISISKSLLVGLFCFVFFGISFSQNLDEKEKVRFKKTQVISETLMGYEPDEYGKASDIGVKKSTRLVDKDGNVTSIVEYDRNSNPTRRTLFRYNSKGFLIGAIVYKGYDKVTDKYKITYDSKNRKTSKKGFFAGNEYELKYSYDPSGNLIQKTKEQHSEQIFKYNYVYNDKLLVSESYSSEKISLVKTFKYNDSKQLIKEDNKTDKFQGYTFEYEYDSLGNRSKETKFTVDDLPYESFEYSHDKSKNVTKIIKKNLDGVAIFKWIYTYDDKGNLDLVKLYDIDMNKPVYITRYIYKYVKKNK